MYRAVFVVVSAMFLYGCTIGNGRICGPQTPVANCDKELYDRLTKSTPKLLLWEKSAITSERRRQDSVVCGGNASDKYPTDFGYDHIEKRKLEGETVWEADGRIVREWQQCMLNIGYVYTGRCYDNDISRSLPKCNGHNLWPMSEWRSN